MKSNAVIRIIFYSLIILLLLGVLGVGLGAGMFTAQINFGTESYTIGTSGSAPANEIRELEIEWAAGAVRIVTADTDTITYTESGGSNKHQMAARLEGDTLTICYSKPSIQIGFVSVPNKTLTVTVPKDWDCRELQIDAASASIDAAELTAGNVEIDCASGDCQFVDCNFGDLDIDTASGDIRFSGSLRSLDCDAASANLNAVFETLPDRIDFDGASGDLDITLPADAGFSVEMDTMSGDFSSEFETARRGDSHICGDGACQIYVDGMSGDLMIRKGK